VTDSPLTPLFDRADREGVLLVTDDLKQCIGKGFTWRCLDKGEIAANRTRLGVNSGWFVAPGRSLGQWLAIWDGVLDASRNRPGPGFDQPGLNACMVRGLFPIVLEPDLMWFPGRDPDKQLCAAEPSLVHFHGIGRHLGRFWKMRSYVRRRLAALTVEPG